MLKQTISLSLLAFCLLIVPACNAGVSAPSAQTKTTFPYEDLSQNEYLDNAQAFANDLIAFLEAHPDQNPESLLEAYHAQKPVSAENANLTANEVVVAYEAYALESRKLTMDSFEKMETRDQKMLQKTIQEEMAATIPNALAIEPEILEEFVFEDGQMLYIYNDGTYSIAS